MRLAIKVVLVLLLAVPAYAGRSFNGSDQALQSSAVTLGTTNVATVSFWLWVDSWPSTTNNIILELGDDYTDRTTGFVINAYDITGFYLGVDGDVGYNYAPYDVTGVSTGAWHHYMAIFDKGQSVQEVDLYIDGSLQSPSEGTANDNNTNNFADQPLNFMAREASVAWSAGRLADVAIWDIRLTGTDATNLAGGTLPSSVSSDNLRGYWKICGTASPEPDSDEGHDATLIGLPTQVSHPAAISASCGIARRPVGPVLFP